MSDHGTNSGYTHGCRCINCRKAATDYQRQRVAQRKAGNEEPPEHGKPSSYTNWGCRCDNCRAAWRDAVAARRAKRRAVSATKVTEENAA
jgi:hypothetical protein